MNEQKRHGFATDEQPPKMRCPLCGAELVRRHRTDIDGRRIPRLAFWGCGGYAAGCRFTMSVDEFDLQMRRRVAKWWAKKRGEADVGITITHAKPD